MVQIINPCLIFGHLPDNMQPKLDIGKNDELESNPRLAYNYLKMWKYNMLWIE